MQNRNVGSVFVILVWACLLAIFAYDAYSRFRDNIEIMNVKVKTLDEMMNENP